MPLTTFGRNLITSFLRGAATSSSEGFYNSTNAWIHVGTSTATFDSAVNSLLSTAAVARAMDATYPTSTAVNVLAFRATYTTDDANFQWNEWGVKNTSATATSTTAGILLNRLMSTSLGLKPNTQSWQLTGQITVTT
jgi:hypothetical protein